MVHKIGETRGIEQGHHGWLYLLVSIAAGLGIVLVISGLVMWPVCYFEKWPGDHLVTAMLIAGFALLIVGIHCLERDEAAAKAAYRRSL